MSKRKLYLISPMLHQGGFERVCITTARLLQDEFDITIVIFSDQNIAYDIEGLRIINLDCPVKSNAIGKVLNVWERTKRFKELIKKEKPEICYSFGPTANLVNCLADNKNVKTWVGLRNYTDVENESKMRFFIKKSDLVICCSQEIEKTINEKFNAHNTATLYNLYDLDKIKKESIGDIEDWPFEDGLRILVSMGRCDDQKCFWHMIKAFKVIHDTVEDVRLVILGAGNFEEYKKLSRELGIEEYIFFAGMRKDPYKFLSRSQIYLLTSYNEGFPNALVEGMSLGLAAVATDCKTGPGEILNGGEYGVLLPVMSKERNLDSQDLDEEHEFATEVINLLNDEELLNEYQEKAVQRASVFSYEAYKKKFLELTK